MEILALRRQEHYAGVDTTRSDSLRHRSSSLRGLQERRLEVDAFEVGLVRALRSLSPVSANTMKIVNGFQQGSSNLSGRYGSLRYPVGLLASSEDTAHTLSGPRRVDTAQEVK